MRGGGVSVSQPGAATRRFALRRGSVCATATSMQASALFEASPLMVWQASRWAIGVQLRRHHRLPLLRLLQLPPGSCARRRKGRRLPQLSVPGVPPYLLDLV